MVLDGHYFMPAAQGETAIYVTDDSPKMAEKMYGFIDKEDKAARANGMRKGERITRMQVIRSVFENLPKKAKQHVHRFFALDPKTREILGFAIVFPGSKSAVYIRTIYTAHDSRRKHIGSGLMEEIEEHAKTTKRRFVRFNSEFSAVEFYKKLGYKEREKRIKVLRNGQKRVRMRKDLKNAK